MNTKKSCIALFVISLSCGSDPSTPTLQSREGGPENTGGFESFEDSGVASGIEVDANLGGVGGAVMGFGGRSTGGNNSGGIAGGMGLGGLGGQNIGGSLGFDGSIGGSMGFDAGGSFGFDGGNGIEGSVGGIGGSGGIVSTGGVPNSGGTAGSDSSFDSGPTGGFGGTSSGGFTGDSGGIGNSGGVNSGGSDGGVPDSGEAYSGPPSCNGLPESCGSNEFCCTSLAVSGNNGPPVFWRSYDGVTLWYETQIYSAIVSDFKLDKFEVTVNRFRKFVDTWLFGWRPSTGSGKHSHLNGTAGLNKFTNGFESGWDSSWQINSAVDGISPLTSKSAWNADMVLCGGPQWATWTSDPGNNEIRPVNCVSWLQAYAFCIWDGGFLPTEAEWNFAAAGGVEQRIYPWGNNVPPTNASYANYGNYYKEGGLWTFAPVGSSQLGNGKYGQSDLAGNVNEWTLDWWFYPPTGVNNTQRYLGANNKCNDIGGAFNNCSHLDQTDNMLAPPNNVVVNRTLRGSNAGSGVNQLPISIRSGAGSNYKDVYTGFRCARAPL